MVKKHMRRLKSNRLVASSTTGLCDAGPRSLCLGPQAVPNVYIRCPTVANSLRTVCNAVGESYFELSHPPESLEGARPSPFTSDTVASAPDIGVYESYMQEEFMSPWTLRCRTISISKHPVPISTERVVPKEVSRNVGRYISALKM